jgi:phospholipase A-2-activating protein
VQVVKFILDNTSTGSSRGALDMPITGGFCDPFTGSSGSGQPQASASASNRPPPAAAMQPMSITGGFCDPFTGGAGAQQQPSTSSPKQVPARVALLFDAPPPPEALRKKLLEFNAALAASPNSCADGAISEAEAAPGGLLDQLLAGLAAAAAGRDDASGGPTAEQIALAARLLRWPAAQAFPGLDVARCLVLHPRAAAQAAANAGSMAAPVLGSLSGALAAAAVSGASPAQQMALRLAVNCFKEPALRGWVCGQRELLLDGFAGAGSSGPGASKGVRLGLATLLLNFAVAGGAAGMDEAGGMQLLSAVDELLGATPPEEGQAVHRALLALGTLLMGPHATALKSVAGDLGVGGLVSRWAGVGGEVGAAAGEVAALLN